MMAQETRKTFHEELDEVQRAVARLAALVTEAIPRGTRVLLASDPREVEAIIEHDRVLDRLSLEIEEHCYQVLALQQPVAIDLRAIVTALRLNSEIERSGDLVVNIAKAARRMYPSTFSPALRGLLERMSEEAVRLTRAAVDAYMDRDAGLAAAIDDMDDTLDDLQGEFIEAVFKAHDRDGLDLAVAVQLALIARFYERIGDHAVNMGERVQYMVTGWLPEHEEPERPGEAAEVEGSTANRAPAAAPPPEA
jgi:phosphate transport system protein